MMIVRGVVMYQRFELGETVLCVEGALVRVAWLDRGIPDFSKIGHTLSVIGRWTSYGLNRHWRITLGRRLDSKEYRRLQQACPVTERPDQETEPCGPGETPIGEDFG